MAVNAYSSAIPNPLRSRATDWIERGDLVVVAFNAWFAWWLVFRNDESFEPTGFGLTMLLLPILAAGVLATESGYRIRQMGRRGERLIDLGPMPRRIERGLTLILATAGIAILAVGSVTGRFNGPFYPGLILVMLLNPIKGTPFLAFTRAGIHREGIWADFGGIAMLLEWEAIQRIELDRDRPALVIVSHGLSHRVPVSGVAMDVVERSLPSGKLGSGEPMDPVSPDVAIDRYA